MAVTTVNPHSLIPALWNIGILLHKLATHPKHFWPECSTINVISGDIKQDTVQKIQSSFICPGEGYFPDGKLKSFNKPKVKYLLKLKEGAC